jgi:hypothetical protein
MISRPGTRLLLDLALPLYDTNNNLVTGDVVGSANVATVPAFAIRPTQTADYYLRATMASCSAGGCYFGGGLYRRAD